MYKSALSTFLGNFTFLSTFKSTFFQLFRTQNLYGILGQMRAKTTKPCLLWPVARAIVQERYSMCNKVLRGTTAILQYVLDVQQGPKILLGGENWQRIVQQRWVRETAEGVPR